MLRQAIDAAKRARKPIGICGQAPSDSPDTEEWLVECGIDSISLNPATGNQDRVIIAEKEARQQRAAARGCGIGAGSGTAPSRRRRKPMKTLGTLVVRTRAGPSAQTAHAHIVQFVTAVPMTAVAGVQDEAAV